MKMADNAHATSHGGQDCMSFLSVSRAPVWAPSALRAALLAVAAGFALCWACAVKAQDGSRILGTVTQGEVDDVTRGTVMPLYDSQPDAAPAANAPTALIPGYGAPLATPRLADEEAALGGDANAMYRLAGRYERGDGVVRNEAIALSWYGRAADEGIADAVPKVVALRDKLQREDGRAARSPSAPIATAEPPTSARAPDRPPQTAALPPSVAPQAAPQAISEAKPAPTPAPTPMPAPAATAPVAPLPAAPAAPPTADEHLRLAAAARDDVEAARLYRAAAELGSAEGAFNLGYRLANGQGVAKNDAEAARWYQAAGEQGSAAAQNNLGFMYASGRGVARSDETAIAWYRKAAEQNYPPAQTNLGMIYDSGRGVAPNPADALAWYSKAAAAGYGPARLRLADMYATGRGVPRDERMAEFWRRSAESANNKP